MVLALAIALVALAAWLLPSRELSPPSDLGLSLLDGHSTSLATLRGRPVLVAFWATTCRPCLEEIPALEQLYREFGPRGLAIIAVTMPYDPPSQVRRFVQRRRLPYPVALDISGAVGRAFGGVDFIPTTFLLGPDGNVLFHRTGRLTLSRTRHLLARTLAQTPRR